MFCSVNKEEKIELQKMLSEASYLYGNTCLLGSTKKFEFSIIPFLYLNIAGLHGYIIL